MSEAIDAIHKPEPVSSRRGITFPELRESRCKFPLGAINDPVEWFCVEPVPIGKAYCEKCQTIAYNRLAGRR
jgi:hypothetical protein